MHAGSELLRSKSLDLDSFNSGPEVGNLAAKPLVVYSSLGPFAEELQVEGWELE